jgi:hypothetical protein
MAVSNPAATFAIYGALAYDIIAATNSSPQTTEINASARSETLMKWVNIGVAQAVLFAAIGAFIEVKRGNPWWPPVTGTMLATLLLYAQYVHARNAGMKSSQPGTETYAA